jgi:hypothetical protein
VGEIAQREKPAVVSKSPVTPPASASATAPSVPPVSFPPKTKPKPDVPPALPEKTEGAAAGCFVVLLLLAIALFVFFCFS